MGRWVKIVMMPCGEFLGRKWNLQDLVIASTLSSMHFLSLFAPCYFTWGAFWVAFALHMLTTLGVTLSFHRNLSHKSFRLPKWLEYLFAYVAVLSLQGSPIEWVSSHRHHHQFTDTPKDVHSPIQGFWFSHIGWIIDSGSRFGKYGGLKNVQDLKRQAFYRFLHHTYVIHSVVLPGSLLYAFGGLPFLVWGLGVRIVTVLHVTLLVNSAGHMWGKQVYNTGDLSRNNWWLAMVTLGEGWHNNHHAFDYSARQGLEWWQIDLTWYVIKVLQAVGWATDVKTPTESQKQRKVFNGEMVPTDVKPQPPTKSQKLVS
ncbi:palmitoyl-monogalactosyldiacylglycerol delta-7 desaturase, chloroplastic-like [Pyrus x bretschneideri]|uniref:palmitoyl-monogalactosyldiacylglycerol delta-7 desaturase, chloroplastic-like n=1 Tax=Pyrus x bretschneideri TaxID=225117 RepID=UPI00202DEE9E|nr:palmitoyl-monogalactosyldiacylglycerol delta-7 desaturase, chloroplastic-like [Pyrus x bretschneideri]